MSNQLIARVGNMTFIGECKLKELGGLKENYTEHQAFKIIIPEQNAPIDMVNMGGMMDIPEVDYLLLNGWGEVIDGTDWHEDNEQREVLLKELFSIQKKYYRAAGREQWEQDQILLEATLKVYQDKYLKLVDLEENTQEKEMTELCK